MNINKAIPIILPIVLFFSQTTFAQKAETQTLVAKFLDTVQAHAFHSAKLDWETLRPAVMDETKDIESVENLKPYFDKVIKSLADYHSSVLYSPGTAQNSEDEELEFYKMVGTVTDEQNGSPPKNFQHRMIDGKYAYINVPPVILEQRKYVDTIGIQLKALDAQNPKAWIIDLTENNGGSIMPMLWQFVSLLESDSTYSLSYSDGRTERSIARFKDYDNQREELVARLIGLDYDSIVPIEINNKNIPIVLLTSRITASSGEFFTASFKGQDNVHVIGQTTNGLTTNNSLFNIGNGYTINLATAVLQDRKGKTYKIAEGIQPDTQFVLDPNQDAKQQYLDAAINYLESK